MTEETQIQETQAEASHSHHYSDEVVLPFIGTRFTIAGGIYTFIFLVLGALTAIEVALTFLPKNVFFQVLLAVLSLGKAYLVVTYYMHLNRDNWIFRFALILPLIIVIISIIYLLGVPSGTGLGYN